MNLSNYILKSNPSQVRKHSNFLSITNCVEAAWVILLLSLRLNSGNSGNVTPEDGAASVNPPDYCFPRTTGPEAASAQSCGAVPIDSADYGNEPERIPKLSAVTLMTPELTLHKKFLTPAAITLKIERRKVSLVTWLQEN